MTTIAYKDGIIAYDSRCTQGATICDDDFNKCLVSNSSAYFLSGSVSDYKHLIACDQGGPTAGLTNVEVHGFIWDGKNLWEAGFSKGSEFWKAPRDTAKPYSAGSGADHAITAMDCGLSAKDAVKMAMKRDNGTGGRIRTYKIQIKPKA